MNETLFKTSPDSLAELLRPKSFDEIFGQKALKLGAGTWLSQFQSGQIMNLIFWGPPGSGKTSAALCFSQLTQSRFIVIQATDLTTQKIRDLIEEAKYHRASFQKKTILFIDEIHRLTKLQQDGFLAALEKGEIFLIGATTENPYYELNRALLSRCLVQQFESIQSKDLEKIYSRALKYLDLNEELLSPEALSQLIELCSGDARKFIHSIELCYQFFLIHRTPIQRDHLSNLLNLNSSQVMVDKSYKSDLISAFIKSIRGSDPDAALLYLAQALNIGEDPMYLARRLVILASEDIGNADPRALLMAAAATQACELVGMPEARIPLAQVVVYLSSCPKSNSSYMAINSAVQFIEKASPIKIPNFLRSSQTSTTPNPDKYESPHQAKKSWNSQDYRSPEYSDLKFYNSKARGFEKTMDEYLQWLKNETSVEGVK